MQKNKITYDQLTHDIESLALRVTAFDFKNIYAIPRGGVPVGILLSRITGKPLTDKPTKHSLIVDDLIDSGKTLEPYIKTHRCAVLYCKPHSPHRHTVMNVRCIDGWIQFPYEQTETDESNLIIRLLELLGENPNREGLMNTPKRYLNFMREFLQPEPFNFTVFDNEGYDEMIIQKDIPFYSLCEHHLAPFFGTATVAYIPKGKIVGLSKLARTVKYYSANFQNQERITSQIADRIQKELNPQGVAVTLKARHFCMEMRGVKMSNVETVTTKVTGVLKDKPEARAEYMASL